MPIYFKTLLMRMQETISFSWPWKATAFLKNLRQQCKTFAYQISAISCGWQKKWKKALHYYLLSVFVILVICAVNIRSRWRRCSYSLISSLYPHLVENSRVVVRWCGIPVVPFTKFWNRNLVILVPHRKLCQSQHNSSSY